MATIQLQTDPVVALALEGEISIASAAPLKQELQTALASEKDIAVSLALASALDITAVQLLWAAAHEARLAGRRFTFDEPVPPSIATSLAGAGIPFASLLERES